MAVASAVSQVNIFVIFDLTDFFVSEKLAPVLPSSDS